jgi:RNA 3'-terminal phosphate cyclase (ATP)
VITIDGSHGEGGGQIVRTAVSLASVTGRSVEVVRLREKRERPGLRPQHLAAVRAAAAICGATTVGDNVGSRHVLFEPQHEPRAGTYRFDIGTAGAATLVLQTVLVPLALANGSSEIEVIGGTHQPMSPAADYLEHVYVPALRRFGAQVDVEYGPAGYYPRGGGRLWAIVQGGELGAVAIVERERTDPDAFVVTSRLPEHVRKRGSASVAEHVPDAHIHARTPDAFSPGAAVTIVSGSAGSSSIGRPGLPMEKVAADACEQFLRWRESKAACDEHLADQLVLPAALARGTSSWTTPFVTEHLTTVLAVTDSFVPLRASVDDGRVVVARR